MFKKFAEERAKASNMGASDDLTNTADEPEDDSSNKDQTAMIGQDLRIAGNLECEGDMVIAGVVDGQIIGRDIVVTNDATVKGDIDCEVIQVFGEVEGQVSAASVELAGTALVTGDISYDALAVQSGATLDGRIKRRKNGAS